MNYKKIITILIAFLIILIVVDCIATDEMALQDYIRGIFTETIGIIITIVVIERTLSKFEENRAKEKERAKIIRYTKILDINIEKYLRYAYRIITPIDKRNTEDKETLNKEFTFNDMVDIFKPSGLIYDDIEPVVFKYINSSEKMYNSIEKMICDIDFEYFPKMRELLIDLVSYFNVVDLYDGIKFQVETKKDIKKLIEKMIKDSSPEPDYEKSNIINTYIFLYKSIHWNKNFINKYRSSIKEIRNNK